MNHRLLLTLSTVNPSCSLSSSNVSTQMCQQMCLCKYFHVMLCGLALVTLGFAGYSTVTSVFGLDTNTRERAGISDSQVQPIGLWFLARPGFTAASFYKSQCYTRTSLSKYGVSRHRTPSGNTWQCLGSSGFPVGLASLILTTDKCHSTGGTFSVALQHSREGRSRELGADPRLYEWPVTNETCLALGTQEPCNIEGLFRPRSVHFR